jgi:hypothetical protein
MGWRAAALRRRHAPEGISMLKNATTDNRAFDALGVLLFAQRSRMHNATRTFADEIQRVLSFNEEQLRGFLKQAEVQRVLRRTLEVLKDILPNAEQGPAGEIVDQFISEERERVKTALAYLAEIVGIFEKRGHPIVVMKTLDHWPDTGSDVDLLVTANDEEVCQIFEKQLRATKQPQSWGDRLAHKFNFRIPGLAELVEVHVDCLGQTGEQKALARGVLDRGVLQSYDSFTFPVPVPEDRIVIATLQRMYRHYYIRLTDIVNIYDLLGHDRVDFHLLKAIAEAGSVWPGVATLLMIVCQHAIRFGADSIFLPDSVTAAARFGATRTYVDQKFVRVPLVPEAANLFWRQLIGIGRKHHYRAMMRLSLLPLLATAAFVSFRVTGNDKGVW